MLGRHHNQQGFTIIEIAIALALIALLTSLAVPAFQTWVHNAQIRNAAEGILNGLQLARAEALRRNTPVELRLGTDSGWTITAVASGEEIQSRSASEGSSGAKVTITPDDADRVTFNGMGWLANNNDGSPAITEIDVDSAVLAGEPEIRALRVVISSGGAMKMCDPSPKLDEKDPRACPKTKP